MELRERLARALRHSRYFTDQLLCEIPEGDAWMARPGKGANHVTWITGHLGVATNFFIGLVAPDRKKSCEDWGRLFGKGSVVTDVANDYPTPAELKAFLTDRGNAFIELLEGFPADDFTREVPQGPPFMYDVAAVFQMAAWHESLHAGQLTVIHRLAGKTPLADRAA